MARLTTVVVATARQRALCRSLLAPTDGCSIVGEGRTVVEALELTARLQPAILLLGSPHGRTAPPLALSLIRSRSPRTRFVIDRPPRISFTFLHAPTLPPTRVPPSPRGHGGGPGWGRTG